MEGITTTGIIKRIEAQKLVGANNDFKIRDLIITTDEQYPQTLSSSLSRENVRNSTSSKWVKKSR